MKPLARIVFLCATFAIAQWSMAAAVSQAELQGRWMIKAVDGQFKPNQGYWDFSGNRFTLSIKGVPKSEADYSASGDQIQFNGTDISVERFAGGVMEAKFQGRQYILQRIGSGPKVAKKPKPPAGKPTRSPLTRLQCEAAVERAYRDLDQLLNIGRENLQQDLIPKEQFQEAQVTAQKMRHDITVANCEAGADPRSVQFYSCLAEGKKPLSDCASQVGK